MVGLGRFGVRCGLVGFMVVCVGATSSAFADTFHLKNGEVLEAEVVRATLNTLVLKVGGSVNLTGLSQIDRVTLTLADGSEITGEPIGWRGGVFELRVAGDVLQVSDGQILNGGAEAAAVAAAEDETVDDERTIALRSLPVFTLKDGETLVGRILHLTGSVATLKPQNGTATPVSRAQIDSVSIETSDGDTLSGELIDWEAGVYRLQIDDRELLANLPEGAANVGPAREPSVATLSSEPSADAGADESEPVVVEAEQADAALLPSDKAAEAENGAGGPANETAIAGLQEDAADDGASPAEPAPLRIEAEVDAVDEGGDSVVFKFQLSEPAVRPLVVLYAATEGSAKAGEDFEAKSGVITFATGSAYAEVEVPVIDDDQGEESETFNLFLSGDPKTIEFGERQISATINDDD